MYVADGSVFRSEGSSDDNYQSEHAIPSTSRQLSENEANVSDVYAATVSNILQFCDELNSIQCVFQVWKMRQCQLDEAGRVQASGISIFPYSPHRGTTMNARSPND